MYYKYNTMIIKSVPGKLKIYKNAKCRCKISFKLDLILLQNVGIFKEKSIMYYLRVMYLVIV